MKRILLLIVALSCMFGNCTTADTLPQGKILGIDRTACPCCGGYLIVIGQLTYRFFESDLPTGSTVLQNASFPIDVELEYEDQSDLCNGLNRIVIKSIARK